MTKPYETFFQSPIGTIRLRHTGKGISSLIFLDQDTSATNEDPVFHEVIQQLTEYFNGQRTRFNLDLDLQGTDFQKKVWHELMNIGYGLTTTYADLSKKLGDLKAIRAVGKANGSNPVSIIIPCHRVIGSDGSLTGYAGGLWRKKWLLDNEQKHAQLSLF